MLERLDLTSCLSGVKENISPPENWKFELLKMKLDGFFALLRFFGGVNFFFPEYFFFRDPASRIERTECVPYSTKVRLSCFCFGASHSQHNKQWKHSTVNSIQMTFITYLEYNLVYYHLISHVHRRVCASLLQEFVKCAVWVKNLTLQTSTLHLRALVWLRTELVE